TFREVTERSSRAVLLSLSLPMSSRARTSPPAARRADRETKWQNLRLGHGVRIGGGRFLSGIESPKVSFAMDSALEGDGFELPVPQQIRSRFRASSPVSHDRVDGLATRNRRFESVSFQRRE